MQEGLLKKLEGKHTLESFMQATGLKKASALNCIAQLRKSGHLKTEGGGKQKRIYTISLKQFIEGKGMFTIINAYAKNPVFPAFQHIVHGKYDPEHALIDAILLKDFRILQQSLYIFNHIKKWTVLHKLAKKHHLEPVVGVLYDFARTAIKTKRMPDTMRNSLITKRPTKQIEIISGLRTNDIQIKRISDNWNVKLPFSLKDKEEMQ
jgi:hypothetical protein